MSKQPTITLSEDIQLLIDQLEEGFQSIGKKKNNKRKTRNVDVCMREFLAREKKNARKDEIRYLRRKVMKRRELYAESSIETNNVGAIDTRQGIQLLGREVTSMAERSGYVGDHEMSEATIKETSWDLSRIVERPTLVCSIPWTAAASILYTGSVPASILPIKLAKIPFQTFQYWAGDVILRLQVAGSPIVQGILGMSFVPLVTVSELNSMSWDFCSLSLNPTVYLYANTNTHAELRIPYNHPQSYLQTDFPVDPMKVSLSQNLGFVLIYVLEPLIAVGSVTSINVSLFSIMENNQFKVPRMSSSILTAESGFLASAISSLGSIGTNLLGSAMSEFGGHVKEKVKNTAHKKTKDLISDVSTKALPSNFIGDAIDIAGGLFDTVTGFLGLDNPTIPTECGRTIMKSNGSMNYAVGPEHIEKMSVMPSSMTLVTPETFATVTDEMDVGYLYRRYSYLGRFSITKGSDGTGKRVFSIPLSPFPTLQNDPVGVIGFPVVSINTFIQGIVSFPLISYLGLPYRYWSGGLKYKFLVCSSSLHTCKLFVAFNYGVWTVPTDLLDACSQYGIALEISQGSNEFEFAVPYVATTPYKEVCRGRTTKDNSMGTMNVVVMNPLVAPDTVAASISIAVFIAGSDDFSYEYLSTMNTAVPVFALGKPLPPLCVNEATLPITKSSFPLRHEMIGRYPELKAESMVDPQTVAPTNISATVTDMAVGENEDDSDVQIAPPQVEMNVDDHFGITSISLRNLAKKYQMLGTYTFEGNQFGDTSRGIFFYPIQRAYSIGQMGTAVGYKGNTIPAVKPNGLLSWMAPMYRQFKGSMRFKAVVYVDNDYISRNNNMQVFYLPGPSKFTATDVVSMMSNTGNFVANEQYLVPATNSVRAMMLTSVASNVAEFEVPYSSIYQSLIVPSGDDIVDDRMQSFGSLAVVVPAQGTGLVRIDLYAAFGDETRFGTLYRVPLCYVPTTFKINKVGTDNMLVPYLNVGYGEYREPVQGDWDNVYGESRSLNAEAGIRSQTFTRSDLRSDSSVTSMRSGTNSVYKQYRPKNAEAYVRNRMIGYVSRFPGITSKELAAFYNSLTITRKLRSHDEIGKVAKKYGILVNKEGNYEVSHYRRTRTNRRPVKKEKPTEDEFFDAPSSFGS